MLTMLIGGSKDGEIIDVRMNASAVVVPVMTEPKWIPEDASISYEPFVREIYDHHRFVFHDASGARPEFDWREDVFIFNEIDPPAFTEPQLVSITMRLYRERWRRKVIAETPEYVLNAWRKDGIKC